MCLNPKLLIVMLVVFPIQFSCIKSPFETVPSPANPDSGVADWKKEGELTYGAGSGRFYLNKKVKTTFPKKAPKRLYIFEGTPHEMGVLMGMYAGQALTDSAKAVKALIQADLPFCKDRCAEHLFQFLEGIVVRKWNEQVGRDPSHIPPWFVDEMNGLLEGAKLQAKRDGIENKVTMADLILPNYVAEVAMALILECKFMDELQAWAEPKGLQDHFAGMRREHIGGLWRLISPLCDGYAVKDEALASKDGVLVARSLQAGGKLWADGVSYIIRIPKCNDGTCEGTYMGHRSPLLATLSVGTLGQVGSLTCMNSEGFATGTQTLRSSAASAEEIGVGSALLCRYTADVGKTTDEAIAAARRAVRGVPYIHIMGDPSGDIAAAEIIRSEHAGPWKKPYDFLEENLPYRKRFLREVLPADHFSSAFPEGGVYKREPNYQDPPWLTDTDVTLFVGQGWPLDPKRITEPDGMIWSHYWEEWKRGQIMIGSFFFPPARAWPNAQRNQNKIVSTNYSLQPEICLSAMTICVWASGIESEAGQWRFDSVNRRLYQNYGNITVDMWKGDAEAGTGMQYISPWAVPGYPLNKKETSRLPRSEYGKVHVSGSLAIMDLTNRTTHAKFGYWGDGWTAVNLNDWLDD